MSPQTVTFRADAVLFDMDGTLTDSIAAVEAAWTAVATSLGLSPAEVIAATHGKRAIDNLRELRPEIKDHEMEREVELFEQSILDFADEYAKKVKREAVVMSGRTASLSLLAPPPGPPRSNSSSGASTPSLTSSSRTTSTLTSPASDILSLPDIVQDTRERRPSFATRLSCMLSLATLHSSSLEVADCGLAALDLLPGVDSKEIAREVKNAWNVEADGVDRSIRILPGVRKMIDSLPEGRWAVATSGAKTYAHGAMTRVGITPPPTTITADDPRLLRGKPFPDPFLLAASCLGYDAKRCVIFEDSPSGIRAGVASGAKVIAVCTSHQREQIDDCGANWVVPNMQSVTARVVQKEGTEGEEELEFTVQF